MIDPIHSLAFSIHSNRGVYALLLGSGISRAAKIPTGWDITLDLVRKLATVSGDECEPSPEQWYLEKFGKTPDYSELLNALAKTPAERQQLLRAYWEATPEEREEGAKLPTQAHRAIAELVAQGFVKVIITTNFDRLMETALADVGVAPTVLSTPDQVHGALPLIHTRCSVLKVHGDYLDTRIRNTPSELSSYPAEFDALLDRIFDEFGLVICGWSAEWDEALRNAVFRAPSRRFATYWASRGEPGEGARKVIDHRSAQNIAIKDADSFFVSLHQHIQSLKEFSRPHPLSIEAAIASLKRYISEPRYRIQFADLIGDEVMRVGETTSGPKFAVQGGPAPDRVSATARVRAYEAACSTLVALGIVGGYWAEEAHKQVWQRAISQLASVTFGNGFTFWLELQRYPATLVLYSLGIGAVDAGRLGFIGSLFATQVHVENREELPAIQLLPPFSLFDSGGKAAQMLEGMDRRHAPLNDWLHDVLREPARRVLPNDTRYTYTFDKLEVLMALGYAFHAKRTNNWYWAPPGAFGYRKGNRERVLNEIDQSLTQDGAKSAFVTSGIFGKTLEECTKGLADLREFVKEKLGSWW